MRQITRDSVTAFLSRTPFDRDGMSVIPPARDAVHLYLGEDRIATIIGNMPNMDVTIRHGRWPTPKKRERLNGLLTLLDVPARIALTVSSWTWEIETSNDQKIAWHGEALIRIRGGVFASLAVYDQNLKRYVEVEI